MIYLSTGYFQKYNFNSMINLFKKNKINNIEFSGGKYDKNIKKKLTKLSKKKYSFIFHNYFPVPKKPFIINLSSSNAKIQKRSINHFKKMIRLAQHYKIKNISIHAGFLINFNKNSFKILSKKDYQFINKKFAEKKFLDSLLELSKYSKSKNISILVENNVITKNNFLLFKKNPFLFTDSKNIVKFLKKTPSNVGLLMDTGHFKVSCKTLGLNINKEYAKVYKFIKGYHLSDNNGIIDSNNSFNEKAWWFKKFKKNLDYYSIEVYSNDFKILKKQISLVNKFIN